jgi:flagellar basal body rod protein FlgG
MSRIASDVGAIGSRSIMVAIGLCAMSHASYSQSGVKTFTTAGDAQPKPTKASRVIQGSVEKSNVRGVVEMSRMIEITRAYTQLATILQQQTDQGQQNLNKLAEVPN